MVGKNALLSGFGVQENEAGWLLYRFKKRYLKYLISEIIESKMAKPVISLATSKGGKEGRSGGCKGDSGSKMQI